MKENHKEDKRLKWNLSKAKKEFDKVFSVYIRQRDKGICFTCGLKLHWQRQQCGHFFSRQHMATRYDEDNNHCQCISCNVFKHGNMGVYASRLEKKYGFGIIQKLEKQKNTIRKWTVREMVTQIDIYKEKTKKLSSF